jgi:hypothetical protein
LFDPWPPEQEQRLKSLIGTHSTTEVAKLLGRTRHSVYCKARRMGLMAETRPCRTWTPEEIAVLWKHAGMMTIPLMAKRMSRSEHAIRCKLAELGINCRQGMVTLMEAGKILGCDRKQVRKYLKEVREAQYSDGRVRKIQYHMTPGEFADVAQLMLDTGTMRKVRAQTLFKVIREYGVIRWQR